MPTIAWLDSSLGSTSKVRILRALCAQPDRWFTEADLSRAIGMSPNTVNLALGDLTGRGPLEVMVLGRSQKVRLRSRTPKAAALRRLFESETHLFERIRQVVGPRVGRDASCILFGSAARGDMGPGSDVDLLIVAPTKDRAAALDVRITSAARAVHAGPYRALHLTPAEVRARWGSSLLEAIRREGVLLGGKRLEAYR